MDKTDEAIAAIPSQWEAICNGAIYRINLMCPPGRCGTQMGDHQCGSIVTGGWYKATRDDGVVVEFISYSTSCEGIERSLMRELEDIANESGPVR